MNISEQALSDRQISLVKMLCDDKIKYFTECDILELLLLFTEVNPRELSMRLLDAYGGVDKIVKAHIDELLDFGMTDESAIVLKLVPRFARLYSTHNDGTADFSDKHGLCGYLINCFLNSGREGVYACAIDTDNQLHEPVLIRYGSIDKIIPDINSALDVIRDMNSPKVAVVHVHPNGSCAPSRDDLDLTLALMSTLDKIDIRILDHIITGEDGTYFLFNGKFLPHKCHIITDKQMELLKSRAAKPYVRYTAQISRLGIRKYKKILPKGRYKKSDVIHNSAIAKYRRKMGLTATKNP